VDVRREAAIVRLLEHATGARPPPGA